MGGMKAFEARLFIGRENIMGDKPKVTIESMETYGKNLYVGTSDYCVHHYMMNIPGPNHHEFSALHNMRRQLGIKRAPIQIRAAAALNRLLVNCDGVLVMLNMIDLVAAPAISGKIKNIRKFQVNKRPVTKNPLSIEICVAFTKKKVLQLFQIHEDRIVPLQEISLSSHVETFCIDHYATLVCTQTAYTVINYDTGQRQELFTFTDNNNGELHVVESVGPSEFLISAAGGLGVFVCADGTSNRPPMQWTEGVFAAVLVHPYVIALNSDSLTVHSIVDQQLKQKVSFQGGFMLAGCEDSGVLVSTAKDIFALAPVPLQEQVKMLLADQRVDEAVELVKASRKKLTIESYDKLISRISCMAGFVKFKELEFETSKINFREGNLDPRELICLFEGLMRKTSKFKKSQPPLHCIPNIRHMCDDDTAKIWACQEFLQEYLEEEIKVKSTGRDEELTLDMTFTICINLAHLELHKDLEKFIGSVAKTLIKVLVVDSELAQKLAELSSHHCLAIINLNSGFIDRAFETWKLIAQGQLKDKTFPGLNFVSKKLSDFCPTKELFLLNADWILKLDQAAGAEAFVSYRQRVDESLWSDDDAVDLLQKYPEALVHYLHYLVVEVKCKREKFHTHLVSLCLERVLKQLGTNSTDPKPRHDLQEILRASDLYRINLILGKVVEAGLHDEQVILYCKLRDHDKALNVLVRELNDLARAELYCVENCSDENDLFHVLLSMYVSDLQARPDNAKAIVELLNRYAERFRMEEVLTALPGHWKVSTLMRFLQNGARSPQHQLRLKTIELMMLRTRVASLQRETLRIESRQVRLHEGKLCPVCNRPLGDQPFVCYPNSVVVHVACSRDKHVCPITGKVFKLN